MAPSHTGGSPLSASSVLNLAFCNDSDDLGDLSPGTFSSTVSCDFLRVSDLRFNVSSRSNAPLPLRGRDCEAYRPRTRRVERARGLRRLGMLL